jgi:AcrR family transcriptional regulator
MPAPARRERADAARNRRAILRAAEELLAAHRPEEISMEQVAAAAGVGKGTVFHRFGNRMGLMRELMLERVFAVHEAVAGGPPPLGPGAPPRERLLAFLDAIAAVVTRNKGLVAALGHAEALSHHTPEDVERSPVYVFWHTHIAGLLAEARPGLDAGFHAHLLLAPFGSPPVQRLLDEGDPRRLSRGLCRQAAALLDAPEEEAAG